MNFRKVYDAQFPFVWRTLRRFGLPESDAADAAQEVFLVVHRRLGEFEGRSRITTWLFRICYRVARARYRERHLRHEEPDGSATEIHTETAAGAEEVLQQQRDLQLLDAALAKLDLEQRAVFTLFELEEMTGEEISDALEIPLGTVYSRLRLARVAFRKAIQRELAKRAHPGRPAEQGG